MRRYRSLERRWGRVSLYAHSHAVNLPRISVGSDQDAEWISLSYGTWASDPVVEVSLDLAGTRVGKVMGETVWWVERRWRRWRERRRG